MNKKIIITICTVVAYFLGALWVDYVPAIAPLVAFLELGVGFAAGFLICKDIANAEFTQYKEEIESVRQAHKAILAERDEIKEVASATAKIKKTRKPKATPKE